MSQQRSDELNSDPGLDAALERLKLGDFQTRWDVAKTLPDFGAATIAPLLTILEEEDTDWELLWFVARILGNLNDPAVIAALIHLLKTADHAEVSGMAATALTNYGVAAIEPLSDLLQDESTRLLAVQALVQIRHADVVAPLLGAASDPSPTIRAAAIEALSHFYDPAIAAALLTALNDLNPQVRKAAVVGLGIQAHQFDQPELVEHLKQRLWDFNPNVCTQAAIALARVGTDPAADALFELLQSSHTPLPLQMAAVRSLARIDTVHALNHLQHLLHPTTTPPNPPIHSSTQQEILTVLGRVESPTAKAKATEILLELLNSRHSLTEPPQQRQTIALSLGQLGQLQSLDALIALLADPHAGVRFHAIAALKQLQSETAYQRLQALAATENLEPELQAGVNMALQEWRTESPQ